MVLVWATIPVMILGVAIAVVPLVYGIVRERRRLAASLHGSATSSVHGAAASSDSAAVAAAVRQVLADYRREAGGPDASEQAA